MVGIRALRKWLCLPGAVLVLACSMMTLARASDVPVSLVAFGDSLTAGYGLKADEAFPAQLQMALQAKGHKVEIMNAGVSGDTTADGLARVDWSIEPAPDAVILELGANDALRRIDPKVTRANLEKILSTLKSKNVDVLIAGMKSPTNWGPEYAQEFDAIFPDLAAKYGYPLYPFFLDGVALQQSLVQPDGLHPTAKGVAEIVKRMLPETEKFLERVEQRKAAAK